MTRLATSCVGLSGMVTFALLLTACGGGSSPKIGASAHTTTAATAPSGPGAGRPVVGGSSGASRGSGNHVVMMVGNAAQGARFAACMRSHGEPNFPDPDPQGTIQFGSGIDPRSPDFRSAMKVCSKLLPASFGQPPTAAQLAHVQQQLLAFSTCMRARGIAGFPDPSGAALPRIQAGGDLDPNSPRFQGAYQACRSHLPPGLPSKALGGVTPPGP